MIEFIKEKRPGIGLNTGFIDQLKDYYSKNINKTLIN